LIRDLPTADALAKFREILTATGLRENCGTLSLRAAFEAAYDELLLSYRCEYLYKNAIASKILMGRHSLRTAGILTELQVDDCKLDLLMVNGQTVAYEIKTELDSPDRLFNQLATYQRAFECVYVVTHESCASRFTCDLPPGVGIMQLSSRYTLCTMREAKIDHSRLDPGVIFNMLRRAEYVPIIRRHFGAVPAVPNTRIYTECRRLFLELSIRDICSEISIAFHERSRQALALPHKDAETAPHSLMLHVLSGNVARQQYDALSSALL
jgi:hypothetical protein